MQLTTKGRFAVTAMIDLAGTAGVRPIPLIEISKRQGISLFYLEQLFGRLRQQGLIISTRGPSGGYRLARGAKDITIADIITAAGEMLDATMCKGKADCLSKKRNGGGRLLSKDTGTCATHHLWMTLNKKMYEYLASVSLADLLENPHQESTSNGIPHSALSEFPLIPHATIPIPLRSPT